MFRPFVKSVAASQEDLEAQVAALETAVAKAGSSVPVGTSDPSSPAEGDMYYNKTAGKLKIYVGSAWVTLSKDA